MPRQTKLMAPSTATWQAMQALSSRANIKLGTPYLEVESDESGRFPTQSEVDQFFLNQLKGKLKGGDYDHGSY